jgi:hypothetical protein
MVLTALFESRRGVKVGSDCGVFKGGHREAMLNARALAQDFVNR